MSANTLRASFYHSRLPKINETLFWDARNSFRNSKQRRDQ